MEPRLLDDLGVSRKRTAAAEQPCHPLLGFSSRAHAVLPWVGSRATIGSLLRRCLAAGRLAGTPLPPGHRFFERFVFEARAGAPLLGSLALCRPRRLVSDDTSP